MAKTKDQVALDLAESHAAVEPSIIKIVRIQGTQEGDESEPIKLLEVNSDTVADGIVPIIFGRSPGVPYPSDVIDITPEEFERVQAKELQLPEGWSIGDTLFERDQ